MDAGLNDAQKLAVNTLAGPMLVLAGAGSGKTRVVTFRIANLIKHGTKPSRILAVTFTNKAAQEMQHRVAELISLKPDERPEISTFHSLCVRILRRQAEVLGYPAKFSILDASDQSSICRKVLREIRMADSTLRPRDLQYLISHWKNRGIRVAQAAHIATTDKEHIAAVGYRRYQDELMRCAAVDFDDLLLLVDDLFGTYPDIRKQEASRFDHLLVDEYQDTNGIQYNIVRALAEGHRNICVVGDDDQSIYGFRGSEVEHILSFPRDWSGATEIRLEANYRSVGSILELANTLIAYNSNRFDKILKAARAGGKRPRIEQFKDEESEAEEVVKSIRIQIARGERNPREIAILFRTNEQPRVFEQELRKHDIPYVILGSKSFFDRKEVKDIVSYLRVLSNPQDEPSMRRIVNAPPRGISNASVMKLIDVATEHGVSLWEVMLDDEALKILAVPARDAVRNFIELIRRGIKLFEERIDADRLQQFITDCRYEKEVARNSNDDAEREMRWSSVEEVVNSVSSFTEKRTSPKLESFLEEIALAASDMEEDKDKQLDKDAVALLTLHASKGLEYPVVYMVGLEEGILPHKRAVAVEGEAVNEERRLAYVGVTRAQDELTMSMALTRRKWGRVYEQIPSRFLFEMIGQADNPNAYNPGKKVRSGK
tara:strand:+ start:3342 stop:5315 length:1974 start_codon:yes stop_codon:yes gene_type:complete